MKKLKVTKLIASLLIAFLALALNPMYASAEWKQLGDSWWYSQGSSYATGWRQIDGQWYYFDSNGYMKTGWLYDNGNWFYLYGNGIMANDATIDGYYLNSSGAWTTDLPNDTNKLRFTFDLTTGTITKYIGTESTVIIPNTISGVPVKRLGDYAFEDNTNITSVTIPDGVISIGDDEFRNCSNLKSITIPDSVVSIGAEAFRNCSSLTNINANAHNADFVKKQMKPVLPPPVTRVHP